MTLKIEIVPSTEEKGTYCFRIERGQLPTIELYNISKRDMMKKILETVNSYYSFVEE